jgi:hypothetical protein
MRSCFKTRDCNEKQEHSETAARRTSLSLNLSLFRLIFSLSAPFESLSVAVTLEATV